MGISGHQDIARKPARRLLLKWIGFLFAGALLAISATMNWHFGTTLGKGEVEQQLFGVASLAIDGLKAVLPLFVIFLWKASYRFMGTLALMLWLLCFSWSMASAIGFSASSREMASAGREGEIERRQSDSTREAELRTKLAGLPGHRAAGVIRSELETVDVPVPVMRRTRGCTDFTREDSRLICEPALKLRRELAVAEQAEKLEAELKDVTASLRSMAGSVPLADPQVHTLSSLTMLSPDQIKVGLSLLIAVLVEFASAFGFTLVALATSPETLQRIEVRAHARAERDRLKAEIGNARLVKAAAKAQLPAPASPAPAAAPLTAAKAVSSTAQAGPVAVQKPAEMSQPVQPGPRLVAEQPRAQDPAHAEPVRRGPPAATVKSTTHQVEGIARQASNASFGAEDLALPSNRW